MNDAFLRRCGVLLAACVAVSCGCMTVPGRRPPSRNPQYHWGFFNATAQDLRAVQVRYAAEGGVFASPHAGYLMAGGEAHWEFAPGPIPPKAAVSWETLDRQAHERQVEVASKVADLRHFTGTVYLYFAGNGVEVIPMTSAEEDREAAKGISASLGSRARGDAGTQPSKVPAAQPASRPAESGCRPSQ